MAWQILQFTAAVNATKLLQMLKVRDQTAIHISHVSKVDQYHEFGHRIKYSL